jgi:hypothetical protein
MSFKGFITGAVKEWPAIVTGAGVLISLGLLHGTALHWTSGLIAAIGAVVTGVAHQSTVSTSTSVDTPTAPIPVVTSPIVTPPTSPTA